MNPLQTIRIAIRALLRNKMRSFLTMLGIIIGVGAVIAMVAIGEGAKSIVQQQFAAMGTNMLIVLPGSTTSGGVAGGFGSMPTITWDDLKAIQTEISSIRYAAPALRTNAQLVGEEQNWQTSIYGSTPEYFSIRNWRAAQGALITLTDVEIGSKIVVIGQTVAKKLFGASANPIGQVVRIKNVPFEVVGVLEAKGQSAMGQDYDDTAVIPVSTYQSKIQGGLKKYLSGSILVSAVSAEDTRRAEKEVANLLRDRHHIEAGGDDDFSVRNLTEIANAQQEGTKTITTLLASVAAVSLLVGGIGIMNIMLVSVTERTREIGVRMAIGAKPRQILAQFLVESLALSLMGGIIGIVLGTFAALRIGQQFGWPSLIRPDVTVISAGFSAIVGIIFGLYPARKASKLDPIQALRFE